ncbi:hypothetical protein BS50DRAFT_578725 [Corynespora cassiicola Philippines]|uniref:Uncharacterized protein n=1 Tax=Corynespora cassiicola Philippines TaxID=1448308 RepID=A0A2T2N657_CORCC|nr:hypothetical protein BS50DRAFT_578725 [Corynespora cassiicola Philippines]
MSASSSGALQMVSNGKRFRLQWQAGDGDGNPNARLIKCSSNLLKGHPTWKVFLGDIPLPIIRGTQHEPPHYVYLDDRPLSGPLTTITKGTSKTSRKSRGRPAYLAASCTAYAKVPLRGKDKWYEFAGAPEVIEYRPLRLKRKLAWNKRLRLKSKNNH